MRTHQHPNFARLYTNDSPDCKVILLDVEEEREPLYPPTEESVEEHGGEIIGLKLKYNLDDFYKLGITVRDKSHPEPPNAR